MKEERYGIFLARDHFNGIAVQIAEFVPIMVDLGMQMKTHVVWQRLVAANRPELGKQQFQAVDPNTFHAELQKVVAEAKATLAQLKNLETIISGGLTNYFSQAQHKNA